MLQGWSRETVDGHICELFEPSTPNPHGYTVIYLHGMSQTTLSDNEVYTRLFARHGLRVVAPLTRRSWWADRVSPDFDPARSAQQYLLESVLPWIAARWDVRPPRIALFGTSMGGQGALRLAFKFPAFFPTVAALAPAIDHQSRYFDEDEEILPQMYDSPESVRQDTATLHLHPLNYPRNCWFACDPEDYPWHESADRLRSKMYASGILYDCDLETSAGGHTWAYYNHMAPVAIDYLAERLERERLRVA
jgi:S-formylglutathione hydrolase FrmB